MLAVSRTPALGLRAFAAVALLALVASADDAEGHGIPPRKSVAGPEITGPPYVSSGGMGTTQEWFIGWSNTLDEEVSVIVDLEDTMPPEFTVLGARCEIWDGPSNSYEADCTVTLDGNTALVEDVFLPRFKRVHLYVDTVLDECPAENPPGSGVSRTCNQATFVAVLPDPYPAYEAVSDDYFTAAFEDPTCLAFQGCSTNEGPELVGALACTAGDCQVTLEWEEAVDPENDPLEYDVYRGPGPGQVDFGVPHATTAGLTYVDTDVEIGSEYCYVLRASDGVRESENSNECCATVDDFTAPEPTADLSVSANACSVLVSWGAADPCSGLTGYEVYRDTTPPVVPGVAALVATSPTLPITDTAPGDGTFHYLVVATNGVGATLDSNEDSVDVTACVSSIGEPFIFATCDGADTVLDWNPVPEVDDYVVYRGTLPSLHGSGYDHAQLPDPGACGFVDPTWPVSDGCVLDGQDHYYLVVARGGPVEGPYGSDSLGLSRPTADPICP